MSTSTSYTAWTFLLQGDLIGNVGNNIPQEFSLHSGADNVPSTWTDTAAITLANAIAAAYANAGFTNVTCTVQKDVYTDVTYAESNGQLS